MVLEAGMSPREIFAISLVAGISLLLFLDRKKVRRHYIIFYRRTEKGLKMIDRIAALSPGFWNRYASAGVVAGAASIVVSTALMAKTVFDMVWNQSTANGPSAVLPGLGSEVTIQPGVSFIPVEYWVIGVGILMFFHEMSHGIVARMNDFDLNSVGWVVMGIIPGAFVEPKGEEMLPGAEAEESDGGMWDQGTWKQRLQVLAAGSFANYIVAGIFIAAHFLLLGAVTQPSGVFYAAQEGYPASAAGMNNGSLESIDGRPIEKPQDVIEVAKSIEPNETVSIRSSEGNFTFEAASDPEGSGGYMGIRVGSQNVLKESYRDQRAGIQWFISLIYTVGWLNLLIGLFNMTPIKPLDGGLFLETVVERYREDWKPAVDRLSALGWITILGSLALTILSQVI
ncbi:MAG: site-2 protease family protein [Candidatus Nanohaloarchaea archaeon]